MKTPRRVPWTCQSELTELYDMLFSPAANLESRRRGLARMSIYISSPSCPSFIHLLHSLVAAELLPYPPPRGAEESQRMRMMMGMAIVRFVNGMVDPLQTGPYARPISHLAATLGLPPSLIALRHRATHEDLPPLPLLHQAVTQCIVYLHQNSFIPLMTSSYGSPPPAILERQQATAKRVDGLLKRWKKIAKNRLRDKEVREEDESAIEMKKVRKELEGEVAGTSGIVKGLVEVGSLVPLAKRKRASQKAISPPPPSLKIWEPLLTHLSDTTMPDLSSTLSIQILDILLNPSTSPMHSQQSQGFNPSAELISLNDDEKDASGENESYRWGLAVWLLYFWRNSPSESALKLTQDEKRAIYRRLALTLLHKYDDPVLTRLHKSLAEHDESLRDVANDLIVLPNTDARNSLTDSDMEVDIIESHLQAMEKRLVEFEGRVCLVFVCQKIKPDYFVVSLHLPISAMQVLRESQSQHHYLAGVD
ncbi:hypothetical protein C361_01704 [Cryptococcus neoformans Tu259-1]|uniref:Uncharacterized protein n=1 Tax=Cryptococcus neoformans Tu259-1 TaxID=1230072 RepID=A0A854QGY7_CRYNE|nr:hypothetical protein C361_01704 [Cryptococcus neoformans var. grubii Tu259-1]